VPQRGKALDGPASEVALGHGQPCLQCV